MRLTVPAAAVAAETAIVAWTGASGIPTARTHGTVGPVLKFVPSGLAFGVPAQLELPYSTRLLRWLARTEAEVTIGVAARGDAAWTTLPATAALGVAAAQFTHFSLYAVTVESPDDVRVRVDTWDTGLDDVAWYGPAGQPIWTSRDPGDVELVETFDGKYNDVDRDLAPSDWEMAVGCNPSTHDADCIEEKQHVGFNYNGVQYTMVIGLRTTTVPLLAHLRRKEIGPRRARSTLVNRRRAQWQRVPPRANRSQYVSNGHVGHGCSRPSGRAG